MLGLPCGNTRGQEDEVSAPPGGDLASPVCSDPSWHPFVLRDKGGPFFQYKEDATNVTVCDLFQGRRAGGKSERPPFFSTPFSFKCLICPGAIFQA